MSAVLFSRYTLVKPRENNFMKIRLVGAAWFHASRQTRGERTDRQKDGYDGANSLFSEVCECPKNDCDFQMPVGLVSITLSTLTATDSSLFLIQVVTLTATVLTTYRGLHAAYIVGIRRSTNRPAVPRVSTGVCSYCYSPMFS